MPRQTRRSLSHHPYPEPGICPEGKNSNSEMKNVTVWSNSGNWPHSVHALTALAGDGVIGQFVRNHLIAEGTLKAMSDFQRGISFFLMPHCHHGQTCAWDWTVRG